MKNAALIICLLTAASPSPILAQPPAKPAADFNVRFSIDDPTLRNQSGALLVKVGEPATFMIGNASYVLKIVAHPKASGLTSVDYSVVTWQKAGLHQDSTTIELTAGGRAGQMMFQRTDLKTGEVRNIQVKIAVDKTG